jgi:putative CocE/NonD family hydrolase
MSDNLEQPQRRGLFNFLFDRLTSWLLGFPSERCSYTTQAVRIPISNGLSRIELAADLLQPLCAKPTGTVLVRSPYGRGLFIGIGSRAFAARGYQVLCVSSRGTFGSGGEFDATRTEVEDGKAVVEWMREQPWYTGTFATVGGSYMGFVQWALLCDPPKDLVAAVPIVSPHDFARKIWETGSLNLDIVRWADRLSKQEQPTFTWKNLTSKKNIEPVLHTVPLAQNVRNHIGNGAPWLDAMLAKPDLSDPHYTPMRLERALDRVDIPVLIVTGWYDFFLEQSMEQYMHLRDRGCNVALTVGPWSHVQTALASRPSRHGFDWIEEHVGGRVVAKRTSIVEYFVTGAQEWRSLPSYPPDTTASTFYLGNNGKLGPGPYSVDSGASTFTFDPTQPTPTNGGNALLSMGSVNDSALARRNDVLVFTTEPLEKDLEFCGQVVVELAHSTSSPFADIFVRVSEVKPNGKSQSITEVFRRLDPQRSVDAELKLPLNHCSHRFLQGRRIRVVVAGGSFPNYARNHGCDDGKNTESEMRAVQHTVHHNVNQTSRVVFPVVANEA